MIQLQIQNFRNLRKVNLEDAERLSVVVGYNEAGKSSLIGAMQWALTGSAYGVKGDEADALLTKGEQRMLVRLQVGALQVTRTRSGGDTLKSIADRLAVPVEVLPALFHQTVCGDGGNRAVKAFLRMAADVQFDPADHFKGHADIADRIQTAKRTGATTCKQIIAFCEARRAQCRPPPAPQAPPVAEASEAEIKALETEAAEAAGSARVKRDELAELETLHKALDAVQGFVTNMAAYESLREAAGKSDPLRSRRRALQKLAALRLESLRAFADIALEAYPSEKVKEALQPFEALLQVLQSRATEELANNPEPPVLSAPHVLDPQAKSLWEQLGSPQGKELSLCRRKIAEELNHARLAAAEAAAAQASSMKQLEDAQRRRALWTHYLELLPRYEEQRTAAELEWSRWDTAVKALKDAENAFLSNTGSAFETSLKQFAATLLNGRRLTISADDGVRLNGARIELESQSVRWRTEICIMAAIARLLKSPLFVLDGADILDCRNQEALMEFLIHQICPFFEHTVVTATCSGRLEEVRPGGSGYTKWLLTGGELTKLV